MWSQKQYALDTGYVTVDYADTIKFNRIFYADLKKFEGKKMSTFLDWLGKDFKKQYFYQGRIGYANFLRTLISDKVVVDVVVTRYKHMKPLNREANWDMREFRRERVGEVKLRYNRVCIKGCNPEELDR